MTSMDEGVIRVIDEAPQAVQDQAAPLSEGDRGSGRRSFKGLFGARSVVWVYAFLVLILLSARFVSSSFGSFSFVKTIIMLAAFTAVASFGQYIVVLTGGLDLSIPNVITFCGALLTGFSLGDNGRVWWALPAVLAIGTLLGVCNGIGVVFLGLTPVVMTLALNVMLAGAVLVYTGGTPKGSTPPLIVHAIQGNKAFGIPIPNLIVLMVVFGALALVLMRRTVFGRQLFAVGSNSRAARLSGVRVNFTLVVVYALSGLSSAIVGVMLCGYGNQSYLGMGDPYLLLPLAAVVVGGTSILGGRGSYLGVFGGAMILTSITTILAGTSLPEAFRQIIYAVIIIVAVMIARQSDT